MVLNIFLLLYEYKQRPFQFIPPDNGLNISMYCTFNNMRYSNAITYTRQTQKNVNKNLNEII